MDYVSVILFYAAVILIVIFLVKTVRKRKENKEEAKKHPKNDSQKELVREVIAAIERDGSGFDKAHVDISNSSGSGSVTYSSETASGHYTSGQYNYDEHGYFVSKEMAYILACQIADHFGGEYSSDYNGYYIKGPRQLAIERKWEQERELERQRIENLKHL